MTAEEKLYVLSTYNKALHSIRNKHYNAATDPLSEPATANAHFNNIFILDFIITLSDKTVNFLKVLEKTSANSGCVANVFNELLGAVNLTEDPLVFFESTVNILDAKAKSALAPLDKHHKFYTGAKNFLFVSPLLLGILSFLFPNQLRSENHQKISPLLFLAAGTVYFSLAVFIISNRLIFEEACKALPSDNFGVSETSNKQFSRHYFHTNSSKKKLTESVSDVNSFTCTTTHTDSDIIKTTQAHLLWNNFIDPEANSCLKQEVLEEYNYLMRNP